MPPQGPNNIPLNSGQIIPQLGLGTWLSQPVGYVKTTPGTVPDAVRTALDIGYRHIDCAMAYGNQHEIGPVFQKYFGEGKLKRDEVFITSKIWNTFHSYSKASEGIDKILQDLHIPYLDMCLIHWPVGYEESNGMFPKDENGKVIYSNVDYMETWKAMENAVRTGKIKSIGVSNFNREQVDRILKEGSIKMSNLQIEAHPYFTQERCLEFCKQHAIVVTAFSPLANNSHLFRKEGQPNLLEEPILKEISTNHKKTPAQIALRWALQRGTAVIPKSCTPSRIQENFCIFDFQLSHEEMAQISGLNKDLQLLVLERDLEHPLYPFHIKF